ncbi:MAG: hypothetical protein KC589_02290 [Nanoarchaeota archaeon]|nr:hypothetical protein [Nanoarchaeota archaeon]
MTKVIHQLSGIIRPNEPNWINGNKTYTNLNQHTRIELLGLIKKNIDYPKNINNFNELWWSVSYLLEFYGKIQCLFPYRTYLCNKYTQYGEKNERELYISLHHSLVGSQLFINHGLYGKANLILYKFYGYNFSTEIGNSPEDRKIYKHF